MFLFKKIVSQFFFPMPLALSICFIGLVLLWCTSKQRSGKLLVTFGLLLLTALSYEPVADALLTPLERRYPVYRPSESPPAKFVVVLGGGYNWDPGLPLSSQLSEDALQRLVEGICIQRRQPGSKLLLSGGKWTQPISNAEVMGQLAEMLGVNHQDIVLEPQSRDTKEEARLIAPIVTTNAFVLVSSASHMARAVGLFEREGLHPMVAPTAHCVTQRTLEPGTFFPSGCCLKHTERGVYEYLGLAWNSLHDSATPPTGGSGLATGPR